jgi:hypothetical protein
MQIMFGLYNTKTFFSTLDLHFNNSCYAKKRKYSLNKNLMLHKFIIVDE